MKRKIRMGMIGGSLEGFIGNIHRIAARLDGFIDIQAGVFSSDIQKSSETGKSLFIDPTRVYASAESMFAAESSLPENLRVDFISIVTPNHLHFDAARKALEAGFHVMCEKPMTVSLKEAEELGSIVQKTGKIFGLTHNYTGYPMVKEARALVKSGKLGKIRKVIAEYPQGWLSQRIEADGQRQASWRTDPAKSGISCCVGDIGTHAENLTEYITGLKITSVAADVTTFVENRTLEDDANILVRFENGAKGIIVASQIATGEENELKIRIYGENGGLEWLQSDPNSLHLKMHNQPKQILRAGGNYDFLNASTRAHLRLPAGHPEGYIESMANLYRNFAFAIDAVNQQKQPDPTYDFPGIEEGIRGLRFIEAVIKSGMHNSAWVNL